MKERSALFGCNIVSTRSTGLTKLASVVTEFIATSHPRYVRGCNRSAPSSADGAVSDLPLCRSPVAAAMPVSLSRVFLARRAHLPARHPPALGSNRMMSQCSWRRRLLVKHQRILAGSAHGSSCRLGDHRKPSTHFFFAGESCFKIGMIPKARSRRRDYYIWSVWCEADNDA
jgi:hypothetical protein